MPHQTQNPIAGVSRRSFLQAGACCGFAWASGCAAPDYEAAAAPRGRKARELRSLKTASLHKKARLIQDIYESVAFSPSGIIYSMLHLDADGIRPFAAADFRGKIGLNAANAKLQLDGHWDYLHGENSIMASGLYLAAQTFRYRATGSKAARDQARRAFRSLDLIFQMGEHAGKPGWMGKPFGFRPSPQTSGDQYVDACWGLWTYYSIASEEEKQRIQRMFIGFADYWRGVDYVLNYFGSIWDQKGETDSYAGIYAMINACAYKFSKSPVHLQEYEKWMAKATWTKKTRIQLLREAVQRNIKEKGHAEVVHYGAAFPLAKDLLKPGEFLCWETTGHSGYVAVAASLIADSGIPFPREKLPGILRSWWSEWKYGMGEDFLPYYWFAVNLVNDTWRPLPTTKLLPKEQWLFGDPFTSYISQVRWNDPLARFMVTSAIAAELCPDDRTQMQSVGRRMLESIDDVHLHWLYDPDGRQLLPELSYYGECLSSEVPASFLAAYWKGRCDKLW